MTRPSGLRPKHRFLFESGGLRADVTAYRVLALHASRLSIALDGAQASDADTAAILDALFQSSIVAVHSLARDGDTLDNPTVIDLVDSLDLPAVGALFAALVNGPQADFAQPASGNGPA